MKDRVVTYRLGRLTTYLKQEEHSNTELSAGRAIGILLHGNSVRSENDRCEGRSSPEWGRRKAADHDSSSFRLGDGGHQPFASTGDSDSPDSTNRDS